MARFSFGGAQDLSGIFADMYRIGDAQAARERNAEDQNVINQWETGEISDEEFYAYARRRIEESAGDPEERSQWEQVLRNAQQTNEGEAIEDTAEDIMDGIESGTKSWDDLLNYYKAQRKKLKPSDPLYRELSQQIDQVEDRKRDNEVAATYGSIDYRFRSGQISGAQAGKEMRALAERYKKNDPQKYYELLGQALDLERGAAAGGGSGGGSGGRRSGGSGGSGGSGLKDTIDELKGFEDRLLSLSRQARDGQQVGSITVPGEDGAPVTETMVLLNKNGTVTSTLRALHEQTLLVYDELEAALIADGKDGEAGSIAARRATFITDYVQPANTISKERQWERLVNDFVGTVQGADRASSPAMAWREIQKQAERLGRWGSRLNTRTTSTDVEKRADDEKVRENPELSAAVRRQTTAEEGDVLRRLSPEFTDEVLPQIQAIMAAVNSDDPAAIMSAFENLPEGSPLADAAPAMAQIRTIQAGLADESWAYAMHPELGVIPVEMIREQTGLGPDGNPVFNTIPLLYGDDGNLMYDPQRAELTQVIAKVGDKYQPVLAVAQQQTVATSDFEWDGVFYRRGQAIPQDVLSAIEDAPEGTPPPPVGRMRATQVEGETFYGMDMPDGSIGWYRNRVPRNLNIPALPAPYSGPAENAQAALSRGIFDPKTGQLLFQDTTGRMVLDNAVATGNRVSMRAFDRLSGPQANIQRATSDVGYQQPRAPQIVDPGKPLGSGTYRSQSQTRMGLAGPVGMERPTLNLAQTLAAARGGNDPLDSIKQIGQSLGLRGVGERRLAAGARGSSIGVRNLNIRRPNVKPVSVRRPNVDVGGLRNMSARLKAMKGRIAATTQSFSAPKVAQLQKARNKSSGGFV